VVPQEQKYIAQSIFFLFIVGWWIRKYYRKIEAVFSAIYHYYSVGVHHLHISDLYLLFIMYNENRVKVNGLEKGSNCGITTGG